MYNASSEILFTMPNGEEYSYTIDANKSTIQVNCVRNGEVADTITIPSRLFHNNKVITQFTFKNLIQNKVQKIVIGGSAFSGCQNLNISSLFNSINGKCNKLEIGEKAFQGAGTQCEGDYSLYFNNYELLTIGKESFGGCTKTTAISFQSCKRITIAQDAFNSNGALETVSCDDSIIAELGVMAFHNCQRLSAVNLTLQGNVFSIPNDCFASQTNLKHLKIKLLNDGVTTMPCNLIIGINAFAPQGYKDSAITPLKDVEFEIQGKWVFIFQKCSFKGNNSVALSVCGPNSNVIFQIEDDAFEDSALIGGEKYRDIKSHAKKRNEKKNGYLSYGQYLIPVSDEDSDIASTTMERKESDFIPNLYLIYGLSGIMKIALYKFIDEYYGKNDFHVLNHKYTTRHERFYDDKRMNYVHAYKKDETEYVTQDDLIRVQAGSNAIIYTGVGDNYQYAINEHDIEKAKSCNSDHFIICNNVNTIIELFGRYKDKYNPVIITVILTEFEFIKKLYQAYFNDSTSSVDDDTIKERVKKIHDQQSPVFLNVFDELSYDSKYYHKIIYNDKSIDFIEFFRKKMLEILNAHSTRFNWNRLLLSRRITPTEDLKYEHEYSADEENNMSFPFVDDYEKISSMPSFRRLQDKCQVFPLKRYDYARTRLTHSIEVASTAEQLGEQVVSFLRGDGGNGRQNDYRRICRNIPIVLRNASLLHDMGNPPFGHFGEDAVRDWFNRNGNKIVLHCNDSNENKTYAKLEETIQSDGFNQSKFACDLEFYEGNAQLIRLLTTLARNSKTDNGEMQECSPNLTLASIATTIKYPTSSRELKNRKLDGVKDDDINRKKNGYFHAEKKDFERIAQELGMVEETSESTDNQKEYTYFRHPLAFLLEAADDISYYSSDLEDALKKHLLGFNDILAEVETILTECTVDITSINRLKELKEKIKEFVNEMSKKEYKDFMADSYYKKLRTIIKQMLMEDVVSAFKENYELLMTKKYRHELLEDSRSKLIVALIRTLLKKYVYHSKELVINEIRSEKAINILMGNYISAALTIFYNPELREKSDFVNKHIVEYNITETFSENYRQRCIELNTALNTEFEKGAIKNDPDKKTKIRWEKVYNCIMLAMDQFVGMTDSFAMEAYRIINATSDEN